MRAFTEYRELKETGGSNPLCSTTRSRGTPWLDYPLRDRKFPLSLLRIGSNLLLLIFRGHMFMPISRCSWTRVGPKSAGSQLPNTLLILIFAPQSGI